MRRLLCFVSFGDVEAIVLSSRDNVKYAKVDMMRVIKMSGKASPSQLQLLTEGQAMTLFMIKSDQTNGTAQTCSTSSAWIFKPTLLPRRSKFTRNIWLPSLFIKMPAAPLRGPRFIRTGIPSLNVGKTSINSPLLIMTFRDAISSEDTNVGCPGSKETNRTAPRVCRIFRNAPGCGTS